MKNKLLFLRFPDIRNLVSYTENLFPLYSLPTMKVILVYYLVLINPQKFMSSYLYFLNNLKDMYGLTL